MNNGTLLQFFHWYITPEDELWKKLANEASRLSEMGISAVWMPPAFKGSKGKYSGGYDVYDLYDLGEFDQKGTVATKFGAKEDYLNAIAAAHKLGMQVYADIIINHLCGADATERVPVRKVNPENRLEFISDTFDIEAYTKFTFPGRNQYSDFKWDFQCFSGVDCAKDLDEKGIFSIQNNYGEGWEDVSNQELGNFDFLFGADIEYRNPAVQEEVKRWAAWYWQTAQFNGVRLDAVKHVSPGYLKEWLQHLRSVAGKELFAVAEFWAPEQLGDMLHFIDITERQMSLFDAPLNRNMYEAGKQGKDYDLQTIFNDTLVAIHPTLSVTLVGNHDTQPLQLLEAPVADWFKPLAYALILLCDKGYPCVFYPDLYGAKYKGKNDKGEEIEIELKPVKGLEELIRARNLFAYGMQRNFLDYPNCIGWTREGDEEHERSGCAVLLSNADKGQKRMEVGKRHAGKYFYDMLGNSEGRILIAEDGWAEFYCPAGSLSLWVRE
ncbi:alpha-amylase [Filimonas effusa]|uniref:Alpha-amylase n=1 Tax=Filimonas effusa TaxID=2508721 RepID=A0A4Q1D0P8_9BACT|nr:alpha-amylase [Filimonas effusa]